VTGCFGRKSCPIFAKVLLKVAPNIGVLARLKAQVGIKSQQKATTRKLTQFLAKKCRTKSRQNDAKSPVPVTLQSKRCRPTLWEILQQSFAASTNKGNVGD